ncbi:regulatory protein RecX [Flavobacterium pallidum]|uniref:Regulatory protein RecX n=1 Tax=Flavobacterium pallidum TaxID=2172098 RepID=A0A2S1SER1_9FLAO|nr:regulatory protein RecX [Flavobacterium pallidum]AWI24842.1 recombinase RecX [Flavobacterium pallidum]
MYTNPILTEAIKKLERFCAYQERCHQEVLEKLYSFRFTEEEKDHVVVHLLEHDFLNEERFARSFARGKHRIKGWGTNRIVMELKLRGITKFNIDTALSEITEAEYHETFERLSEKQWQLISEKNQLKKRKKFCDFLLRKGFESDLIYARAKELEQNSF